MNEQDAITLCLKNQDPRGFEFLVEQYRREAYMHAYGLTGNKEDASDACQDAFIKAFVSIPKLAALDRFYPWFYRILRNTCLNLIKKRQTVANHKHHELECESNPNSNADPYLMLEKQEASEAVWQALHQLRLDQREILVMKYFKGMNYESIGDLLNIPRGTVMSRLYNARKAFRDALTQDQVNT